MKNRVCGSRSLHNSTGKAEDKGGEPISVVIIKGSGLICGVWGSCVWGFCVYDLVCGII
jgi:hypothetical protein